MRIGRGTAAAGLGFLVAAGMSGAWAQLPPGVYAGAPSLKEAPAGAYGLDPDHTAVIVKVSHIGYALSVFRFGKVSGTLQWNPADPARSSLKAVVHTVSIETPVEGFGKALAGPGYLDADRFPDASFVSTAFRPSDATHGMVTGDFTLRGHTHPLTFAVTLAGAGRGFMGHPRIGVEAKAAFAPEDYGLAAMFGPKIRVEIDAEFEAS